MDNEFDFRLSRLITERSFKKEIISFYPTITKTLSHILDVDIIWIHILKK